MHFEKNKPYSHTASFNRGIYFITLFTSFILGLATLLTGFVETSCKPEKAGENIYVPAEWEQQESVCIAWPLYNSKHNWDAAEVYLQMMKVLAPQVKIDICVPDITKWELVTNYLRQHGFSNELLGSR